MNATESGSSLRPTETDSGIRRTRLAAAGIAALTILAYARVAGNGFTTFDDHEYVTLNPHVADGFSLRNVAWAFTTGHESNWHPLTWLSHMLDCQVFGLSAPGHHLVSLALHVATSLLVLRLFVRATGALGASAFVATAFAVHPLHVESVAWASERKDVLCAFFWALALLAYLRYVERPGKARLAAVVAFHLLGLLSKPMIVSLPFTLLLLDAWPLARIDLARPERARLLPLLREKAPLFALSLVSCVVTYAVQRETGAMVLGITTPFLLRLENSVVAYAAYLGKMAWPVGLQAYYPYPSEGHPAGVVIAAAAVLALLTAGAWRARRSRPWLLFGWLWYLVTLAPVIGIVQVGGQAMADRYAYVPMIGPAAAVAWGARELVERMPRARAAVASAFAVAAIAWTALAWRQVGYWKDDLALFEIAKVKLQDKPEVHARMGARLLEQGRTDEAIEELRRSVLIDPSYAEGHNDLGRALEGAGRGVDATEEYRIAVRNKPDFVEAHLNLAAILAADGKLDDAIEQYRIATGLRPDRADAHFALAVALLARERTEEGVAELQRTLELDPGDVRAQRALRRARAGTGSRSP